MGTSVKNPTPPGIGFGDGPLADVADAYLKALLLGDRPSATKIILDAVKAGADVRDIYLLIFQPVQREIGWLWERNRISIAQEHYCTAITQFTMALLYPYIFAAPRNGYSLVATSVADDLHELGVRMVSDFFEMDGWDTYYLGANTPTSAVVSTVRERCPHILAVSATIPWHVEHVSALVQEVRADAQIASTRIIVGGQAFNAEADLWRTIGADGFARDAREAIGVARSLVGGAPL